MNAFEDFVLSICHVDAGSTYNVFPDEALLLGTLRVYKMEIKEKVVERIKEIAESVARAHGCGVEFNITDKYPVVENHAEQAAAVLRVAEESMGREWSI